MLVDSINFNLGTNLIWLETIDYQGCVLRDSIHITIQLSTMLEEIDAKTISISPNPTNGIITLIGDLNRIKGLRIRNMKGKTLIQFNSIKNQINLTALPKGVYLVEVISDGQSQIQKIILN